MLGFFLSGVVLFLFFIFIISAIVATFDDNDTVAVANNSVLMLNLDQAVGERTHSDPFSNIPLLGQEMGNNVGFTDIIAGLKKAKTDDKIKCVYLNVSAPQMGMATMLELRNAIVDFKESKKPVIAYSEVFTQNAYYLASAADKVYLNPQGALEFKGFASMITFFKGALDKLGIEAQIIRVGNYKSAVEPYINTKMSDYNRTQVQHYVDGMYNVFLNDIAGSRKIGVDSLRDIANEYRIQSPEDALKYRFVDALMYKDQLIDTFKKITGTSSKRTLPTISINDYSKNTRAELKGTETDKVAVIYANGEIEGGEGNDETIGSERISRAIRKARTDSNIKAIVLRINSPGGSALASDVIWREVKLAQAVKPIIASFGDVAASGGYYIGCAADSIFVQPNTITGSIGVFGIIPNMQNLLNNKLGITFDGVKTGQYADIASITRPLTAGERFIIQNSVNRTYDTFLSRVADGRKKDKKYIDGIAGGRVWTGTDAVENGLADRVGDFHAAIKSAAKKAKISSYKVVEYPEPIDPVKAFLKNTKESISASYVKSQLGETWFLYRKLQDAIKIKGVQTRMLYEPVIN